jgi:hypothetical protein
MSLGKRPANEALLARDVQRSSTGGSTRREDKVVTYVMTKPCPVCKCQLTKKVPTDTVPCACGQHVWQG